MSTPTFTPLTLTTRTFEGGWGFPDKIQTLLADPDVMALSMPCDVTLSGSLPQGHLTPSLILSDGTTLHTINEINRAFHAHKRLTPDGVKAALFELMMSDVWGEGNPTGQRWNVKSQIAWKEGSFLETHTVVFKNGWAWVCMEEPHVNIAQWDDSKDLLRDLENGLPLPSLLTQTHLSHPHSCHDGLGMILIPQPSGQNSAHRAVEIQNEITPLLNKLRAVKEHNAVTFSIQTIDLMIAKGWMRLPKTLDILDMLNTPPWNPGPQEMEDLRKPRKKNP